MYRLSSHDWFLVGDSIVSVSMTGFWSMVPIVSVSMTGFWSIVPIVSVSTAGFQLVVSNGFGFSRLVFGRGFQWLRFSRLVFGRGSNKWRTLQPALYPSVSGGAGVVPSSKC